MYRRDRAGQIERKYVKGKGASQAPIILDQYHERSRSPFLFYAFLPCWHYPSEQYLPQCSLPYREPVRSSCTWGQTNRRGSFHIREVLCFALDLLMSLGDYTSRITGLTHSPFLVDCGVCDGHRHYRHPVHVVGDALGLLHVPVHPAGARHSLEGRKQDTGEM